MRVNVLKKNVKMQNNTTITLYVTWNIVKSYNSLVLLLTTIKYENRRLLLKENKLYTWKKNFDDNKLEDSSPALMVL